MRVAQSTAHSLPYPMGTGCVQAVQGELFPESSPANSEPRNGGLTELVLTKHSHSLNTLLLPMIAQCSNQSERWVTWFTDSPVDTTQLSQFGFAGRGLRCVYVNPHEDYRWMFWEALQNSASKMVIGTFDSLNQEDLEHFERAAVKGDCSGVVIRHA